MMPELAQGSIEVYYADGTLRIVPIPAKQLMIDAVLAAHDIWEDEQEQARVKVLRKIEGEVVCVCHLLPVLKTG